MKLPTLTPTNGKVIVKPVAQENQIGKLVMPDTKDERRPEQGKVVSIAKDVELDIKKGDVVLFDKYNADVYQFEDDKILIVSATDIHAIVRK